MTECINHAKETCGTVIHRDLCAVQWTVRRKTPRRRVGMARMEKKEKKRGKKNFEKLSMQIVSEVREMQKAHFFKIESINR